MLNKELISVLQNLNSITNTAILKYPVTVLNNNTGDVIVKLNVNAIDDEKFDEIGIFDLNEFLSLFRLFSDYTIEREDNFLKINGSNNTSVKYLLTSPAVLENFNKSENLFTSTEAAPSVATFNLTEEDIRVLKDSSKIFSDLSDINIKSQDGSIQISLSGSNEFNAKSNSFNINKTAETSKEFVIKIPVENFKTIPNSNYIFDIKYNEQKDAYRVLIKSSDIDISILMAVKKN